MLKNDIARYIKNAFTKAGYKTWNFSRKTRYDIGQKDWVDIVCCNMLRVVFFEVKVGADRLSDGQAETASLLTAINLRKKSAVVYAVLTELNYKDIVNSILEGR